MDVEVGHLLVAVPADIGEQAIAGLDQSGLARDGADCAHEARNLGVVRVTARTGLVVAETAIQTMPTGFSGVSPPGPIIPLTATA